MEEFYLGAVMIHDEVLNLASNGEHVGALKLNQNKVKNMSESSNYRIVYCGLDFCAFAGAFRRFLT